MFSLWFHGRKNKQSWKVTFLCACSMLILQLLRCILKISSVVYFASHLLPWQYQYQLYHQLSKNFRMHASSHTHTHIHIFFQSFYKWIMKSWNWSRKLNWSNSQKLWIDVFMHEVAFSDIVGNLFIYKMKNHLSVCN